MASNSCKEDIEVTTGGIAVKQVEDFCSLGSHITSTGSCNTDDWVWTRKPTTAVESLTTNNAQPDGRPAEHRWRRLFNTAKFGWRPLLDAVQ